MNWTGMGTIDRDALQANLRGFGEAEQEGGAKIPLLFYVARAWPALTERFR